MATFPNLLPDDLLKALSIKADSLTLSKNKLIENAIRFYIEHLDKAEYIKSYMQASADADVLAIAEEGMSEYLNRLDYET